MDTQIISQFGGIIALIISLFYLHNQNRQERILSDERWANLKTEQDDRWSRLLESFTDFKNVTVTKFADIEKRLKPEQEKK